MKRTALSVLVLLLLGGVGLANCPPGHHYWPGGYHSGSVGYPAGHYSAGYYKNAVTYDDRVYVADHVKFRRYVAVVPLVELPSYGSYYVQPPTGTPRSEPEAKPAPAPADGMKKEILEAIKGVATQVTTMNTRIDGLEGRIKALEGSKPDSKPVDPPKPDGKPVDPFKAPTAASKGLELMHTYCGSCHSAKSAKTAGGDYVMFLEDKDGNVLLGKLSKSGLASDPLSDDDLKSSKRKMLKKAMPPKKNAKGEVIPEVPDADRQAMVAWVDEELKRREKK